jgi:hypothetical protein
MARLPVKGTPWLLVIQAAMAAREHWGVLEPDERTELARLLRTTRGRPSNLTVREKSELRRLVGKLDLPGLGKDLLPLASRRRRR